MGNDLTAADAVAVLVRASGVAYELRGRLAGGETGAHEVASPDGERLVLKWETEPQAQVARRRGVELTERLRIEARWPVPRQAVVEHDETTFILQELLPGAPIEVLTDDLADQLIELHERRLAMPVSVDTADPPWPGELIRTLVSGGHGYCRHESLRTYDERTARLLDRIERIGRSADPDELPGRDVVHWDWHPGNLLQADGRLRGVIDTDFATIGDARFDLVALALTSWTVRCEPGVRDRLEHAAFDPLTGQQRDAYVAHLLLRFLDWPIRRHSPDEVDFWLAQADRLLGP